MDIRMGWNVISVCLIMWGINFEDETKKKAKEEELKTLLVHSRSHLLSFAPTIFLT